MHHPHHQNKRWVLVYCFLQFTCVACIAITTSLLQWHGRDCFLGALSHTVPTVIMAIISFKTRSTEKPKRFFQRLCYGEFVKLTLTILFCTLIFRQIQVHPAFFFTGFFISLSVQVWGPLVVNLLEKKLNHGR